MSHVLKSKLDRIQSALDEVMGEREASADERVEALVSAYRAEKSRASALSTKLAMREQQLREADAEVARLKAGKACLDAARVEAMRILVGTSVDTATEPWEAIVTAAIRWRRGADRGELAAAVDAFTGDGPLDVLSARFAGAMKANPDMADAIFSKMVSDLKGLAARESAAVHQMPSNPLPERGKCSRCGDEGTLTDAFGWIHDRNGGSRCPVPGVGVLRGEVLDSSFEPSLRPEQYADGAGAQAWRQAMGGKL